MDESSRLLAVAELLVNRVRGRQGPPLLHQARGTLDQAWIAVEQQSEAGAALVSQGDALEAAILERNRDDYLAGAASVVVYAVRALTNRDERWSTHVWGVTDELLEDINERAATPVMLNAVRQAILQVEPTKLRHWAQAQDILGLVQTLRPTIPASVRRIARAASKVKPNVIVAAPAGALAGARKRALEAVGVAAFAKALEPLAIALPLGEVDVRWQPTADRILADVAGTRISEFDHRVLAAGFDAISPGSSG